MEVNGVYAEVFGGGSLGSDDLSCHGSTLSLTPLLPHSTKPPRRSGAQDVPHRLKKESKAVQVPSIPNPFPELCSPSQSPKISSTLGKGDQSDRNIRVYGEDSMSRALCVSPGATARDVCHLLVVAAHCSDEETWSLVELQPLLGLERCLEDHERVIDIQSTWPKDCGAKFVFRKNYAKYEFFKKPMLFFPESMTSDSVGVSKGVSSSELLQSKLQEGSCPDILGFLHVKEAGRKAWKRVYYFLRRSGLYCSTKGSSKEPRHLQYVADLEDLNVYTVTQGLKAYAAPSEHIFSVKSCTEGNMKLFCAEDEQSKTCWITAFRLFKYGKQLLCNYKLSQQQSSLGQQHQQHKAFLRDAKVRGDDEDSLVAMDFTGKSGGRVIKNPKEAESAEQEEGQAWRKREALRYTLPNVPPCPRSSPVHKTQPWFHGGIGRSEAHRVIEEQGQVDGMFLIRESHQHGQCYVLSLSHQLKTKHYLVVPYEESDKKYYTMDDGETIFIDLLQLVEFYQINRGMLPVRLKHPCVRVAL